jgi:hypothetical protein
MLRPVDDRLAEKAGGQLDQQLGAGAAHIEKGIEFDDIHGADNAGLKEQLHAEMRFTIGCPSGNRGADARRQRRVEKIDIEADMQMAARRPHRVNDRFQRRHDAAFVDRPHIDHIDTAPADGGTLLAIDGANAEQGDTAGLTRPRPLGANHRATT